MSLNVYRTIIDYMKTSELAFPIGAFNYRCH